MTTLESLIAFNHAIVANKVCSTFDGNGVLPVSKLSAKGHAVATGEASTTFTFS